MKECHVSFQQSGVVQVHVKYCVMQLFLWNNYLDETTMSFFCP